MKNLVFNCAVVILVALASCDADTTRGTPYLGEKLANVQFTFDRYGDEIKEVSWNADGTMLASVDNNSFSVWNTTTGKYMYTIAEDGPRADVHVSWSPDGTRLATSSDEYAPAGFDIGLISIRNPSDGQVILRLGERITLSTPKCMSWSADGKYLSTSELGRINIWNPDKGYLYNTVQGHTDIINQLFWNTKNHTSVSASHNEIIIWNSPTNDKTLTLKGHDLWINDIDLSSDGTRIVSGSMDYTAIIWDVATGTKLFTLVGHRQTIKDVSWSPDCSKIVTGAYDGGAIIWDASTGTQLFRLKGNEQVTSTVAWSPDGKKVAMNSWNDATIWDASTGKKILTLAGHTKGINRLCWSPDGKRIATGSSDGTVKIWYVEEM